MLEEVKPQTKKGTHTMKRKNNGGEYKVSITWRWEDVKEMRSDWTKEQCLEALQSVGRSFKDRSIEEGWQILEDLIFINEWNWDKNK